jgi:hypothetical protein
MIYRRKGDALTLGFFSFAIKTKHIILVLFVLCSVKLFSIRFPPSGTNAKGFRFIFGPSLGFYNINTNHARLSTPKMSAIIGFRRDIRTDKSYQNFFSFGVDYFFHGLNFKSYYFKPDSLKLYDKSFSYNYSLFIQEINIPFQVKHSFTRENNSLFSPYVMIGYHLRFLLPANINVTQNGNTQSRKWEEMNFKHPLISSKINCFVSASVGWQKNTINHTRAGFFIEANYRYGFSQYFFQTDYSASSLYINGMHLSLLLGVNF